MRKINIAALLFSIFFISCSKSEESTPEIVPMVFQGKFDGQMAYFGVSLAFFEKHTLPNESSFTIDCQAKNKNLRFSFSIYKQNGTIPEKTFAVRFNMQDDPDTPNVDESVNLQEASFLYLTMVGTEWEYEQFRQTGSITITKFDAEKNIIEGKFSASLIKINGGETFTVTDGVFSNIPFNVAK